MRPNNHFIKWTADDADRNGTVGRVRAVPGMSPLGGHLLPRILEFLNPSPSPDRAHSYLNATTGSTRVALLAGT